MSDDFGDTEPEDAWHPDDPIPMQLDNLLRRTNLLGSLPELHDRDLLIEALEQRVTQIEQRRGMLDGRDLIRLEQLVEDLALVRSRHG